MTAASRANQPDNTAPACPRRERRRLWVVLAAVAVIIIVCVLLAPRWARSYAEDAAKHSLARQGWQVESLKVESLGFGQAKLTDIAIENRHAKIMVPEVSLTFGLYDLLVKQRVKSVIVNRSRVEARWAHTGAELVGAALLLDWPQGFEQLPFGRLYLSDAEIVPQPSSGIPGVRINAILESVERNAAGLPASRSGTTGSTANSSTGASNLAATGTASSTLTDSAPATTRSTPDAALPASGNAAGREVISNLTNSRHSTASTTTHAPNARLWAELRIPNPAAHAAIDAEIDFKTQSLRATIDSEWKELSQWRKVPLPPEAQLALSLVREQLTLQAGVSIRGRTVTNWMLFGQSPAIIATAPGGTHVEAINADFGLNVIGTDRFDYGWLRAESGAMQQEAFSLEWQMLHAELKPGSHLTAHMQSAQIQAELSSIARDLMPQNKIATEFANYWQNSVWQAQGLHARLLAPGASPNGKPTLQMGGQLRIGPLRYPWEKTFILDAKDEAQLREVPLLRSLLGSEAP